MNINQENYCIRSSIDSLYTLYSDKCNLTVFICVLLFVFKNVL